MLCFSSRIMHNMSNSPLSSCNSGCYPNCFSPSQRRIGYFSLSLMGKKGQQFSLFIILLYTRITFLKLLEKSVNLDATRITFLKCSEKSVNHDSTRITFLNCFVVKFILKKSTICLFLPHLLSLSQTRMVHTKSGKNCLRWSENRRYFKNLGSHLPLKSVYPGSCPPK